MDNDARQKIADAIRLAESKTRGEIVCVLAEASSSVTALPVAIAALVSLALPWLLIATSAMPVQRILSIQILAFVILTILLCLPAIRVALMPRAARRAAAHRAAMEQFRIRGIARKKDRCGVLIFVSLAERYARIIADDGIAAQVPQAEWQRAVDALTAHMREGRVAEGFIAAIGLCGEKLAAHFPREPGSIDELPDRIYVI